MTAYDAMPVGTVLRDNRGTVWVKRFANGWRRDGATGSLSTLTLVELHSPLVELVATPAPFVDGEGCRWVPPTEPVYRIHPDHGLSDWLTRAQIEADFGQTEETTP